MGLGNVLTGLFSTTNPTAVVVEGGVKGVLDGIGSAANGVREAITGELSPEKRAKFEESMRVLDQELLKGAQAVTLAEAQSGSPFARNWRPGLGWICDIAIACYYIPQALAAAILWTTQSAVMLYRAPDISQVVLPPYPLTFNLEEIIGLVFALLGVAVTRSYDKKVLLRK